MSPRPAPPLPPAELGLHAVTPNEWIEVFKLVKAYPSVKNVGIWAARFGNFDDGAEVRPGLGLLAAVCGLNEKTVRDALAQLREWGLLWRYVEGRKNGRRSIADEYRLTVPDDVGARVPLLPSEIFDGNHRASLPEITAEHRKSGPVISLHHRNSLPEIGPDHRNSGPEIPVDNPEGSKEHRASLPGSPGLTSRITGTDTHPPFIDLSTTNSPPKTALDLTPRGKPQGDGQVKNGITFTSPPADVEAERARQAAALAAWERDHAQEPADDTPGSLPEARTA